MDRFLVKTPRVPSTREVSAPAPVYRQLSIFDRPAVPTVESLNSVKRKIEIAVEESDFTTIESSLTELDRLKIPRSGFESSKIGLAVNSARKFVKRKFEEIENKKKNQNSQNEKKIIRIEENENSNEINKEKSKDRVNNEISNEIQPVKNNGHFNESNNEISENPQTSQNSNNSKTSFTTATDEFSIDYYSSLHSRLHSLLQRWKSDFNRPSTNVDDLFSFSAYSNEKTRVKTFRSIYNHLAPNEKKFSKEELIKRRGEAKGIKPNELCQISLNAAKIIETMIFKRFHTKENDNLKSSEKINSTKLNEELEDREKIYISPMYKSTMGNQYSSLAREIIQFLIENLKNQTFSITITTITNEKEKKLNSNEENNNILPWNFEILMEKIQQFIQSKKI